MSLTTTKGKNNELIAYHYPSKHNATELAVCFGQNWIISFALGWSDGHECFSMMLIDRNSLQYASLMTNANFLTDATYRAVRSQ